MAQVCVVNCCSCETFQGQQVKKGKKWICKMCGEKQSFRKIFAQGSGKECRQVVQKLNMINGNLKRQMLEEGDLQERNNETTGIDVQDNEEKCRMNQTSKWNQFVLSATSDPTEIEQLDDNSIEFTTERETFERHRAEKRKKPIKEKTSDNINECQQGKIQKFNNCKRAYPHSKTAESHLGNLGHEVNDASLPKNDRSCTSVLQRQTCTSTEAPGPTTFSKWSKYT